MTHLDDLQAQRLADATLPAVEARAAADHAAACPACAARIESHRALLAALDGLALPEVPADFTTAVLERIERGERQASRDRRFVLAVGLAALTALVAAVAAGGAPSWIPATAHLAEQLGALAGAMHLGAEVLPGLLGGLRFPAAAACALVALPLLLTLPRLSAQRRRAS